MSIIIQVILLVFNFVLSIGMPFHYQWSAFVAGHHYSWSSIKKWEQGHHGRTERLCKETDLGVRLPAYDGRNSMYTTSELPFTWKEFKLKLIDEEDVVHNTKYGILPSCLC